MDVEIIPEPSREERRAILEALERAEEAPILPPWRLAGLGPGPAEEVDQTVALPRQSRGATRA